MFWNKDKGYLGIQVSLLRKKLWSTWNRKERSIIKQKIKEFNIVIKDKTPRR
jgi:hypothetical protein